MHIIDQGKIFEGKPNSSLAKTCFPYIVELTNGDLNASFQSASVKNGIDSIVAIARSSDGGKSWSEPLFPFTPILEGKAGTLHLAYISQIDEKKLAASILWCDHKNDENLEFFNSVTGGLLPTEACVSFSMDNGLTWSKLQRIEKEDLKDIPTPVMGPIHVLENGDLICPFETSKEYDDNSIWHHKAAYFISHDGGKSWPEHKVVAYDPECKIYYWDHRIANLREGNLVDLFWAYDAIDNKEVNVHMSRTFDFGKNWSNPFPTEIIGQPWPIAINKNTFAVVVVDRNISQAIKLYLTDNCGKSFDAHEPVVIYNNKTDSIQKDKLNEQLTHQAEWFYGLPSGNYLSDGTIMIVYYVGSGQITDINWCKIKL